MPYTHTLGDSDGDAVTVTDDRLPDLTAPAGSDRHGAPVPTFPCGRCGREFLGYFGRLLHNRCVPIEETPAP